MGIYQKIPLWKGGEGANFDAIFQLAVKAFYFFMNWGGELTEATCLVYASFKNV
jgi:hypothetical protein